MTDITIIARYETTLDEIKPFAISKGWQEKVYGVVDGIPTEIDNPESALEYCNRMAKECLVDFLTGNAMMQLHQVKQQEIFEGMAVIKQRVSDALTVNQGA